MLIVLILSLINATDAQWYHRKCGVIDLNNCTTEEFECLWDKAMKNVRVGLITTAIGISSIVIGYFAWNTGWDNNKDFLESSGTLLGMGGSLTTLVGIPIFITGVVRTNKIGNSPNYKTLNLGSLNISPAIGLNQFNDSQYYGLSLSLNF